MEVKAGRGNWPKIGSAFEDVCDDAAEGWFPD